MSGARVDQAIARIEAALARIDAARALATAPGSAGDPEADTKAAENKARVTALVNNHEKLREEVAETLRDLEKVIGEFER